MVAKKTAVQQSASGRSTDAAAVGGAVAADARGGKNNRPGLGSRAAGLVKMLGAVGRSTVTAHATPVDGTSRADGKASGGHLRATAGHSAAESATAKAASGTRSPAKAAKEQGGPGRPTAKEPTGKRAAAKKSPAKKSPAKDAPVAGTVAKKAAAVKKTVAKKSPAKKSPAKDAPVAGTVAKKAAAVKKTVGKKAAAKETAAKKAAAKGSVVRSATAKQSAPAGAATEKSGTEKTASKKTAVKKTEVKKAAVKKAAAKKTVAKNAAVRKAPSKKTDAEATAPAKATSSKGTAPKSTAPKGGTTRSTPTQSAVKKSTANKAGAGRAAKQTGATTVVAKKTPGTATATKDPSAVPPGRIVAAEPGELAVRPGEDPWTLEEVAAARAELESEALRLRGEIDASEQALVGLMRDSGDGAGDDQADTGTKNITREHEMALAANAQEMLDQTRRALNRLDTGTYGLCESCGNPIGKARMQAFPRATLCVECKQKQERH